MKAIGLSLLVLAACTGVAPEPQRRAVQPIVNGTAANGGIYDSVGALCDGNGNWYCTGTYVGEKRVATAGHCLEGGPPSYMYFGADADADKTQCFSQGNQAACARFIDVQSAMAHPSFNGNNLTSDIGVVILTVEPGVAAIPITAAGTGTQLVQGDEGQPLDFAGYGIESDNGAGGGTRLHVATPLTALGPDNQVGISADQMYYTQQNGGPCSGDSGGPAFIMKNGTPHLAGITSYGGSCVVDGVSTRVDTYASFVLPSTPGAPDAGPPGTPDAAPPGTPDAAPAGTPDAGPHTEPSPDAAPGGGGGGDDEGEPEGGCGCRAGGSRTAPGGAALLLLALVLVRRRQRP